MCIDSSEYPTMATTTTAPSTVNNGCHLGRLVDETTGELKEPSHCIIQYGGRVRLPDKLIEILNKDFAPEVIWWQPDGECFAFDSNKVQEKILDVWFRGTKLSSFIRSLNRWGFRRVFYHALPESALAFHHSSFRKNSTPEMLKSMKMSKSGGKATQAMATIKVTESNVAQAADLTSKSSLNGAAALAVDRHLLSSSLFSPNNSSGFERLSQLKHTDFSGLAGLTMLPQVPMSSMGNNSSNYGQQTPACVGSNSNNNNSSQNDCSNLAAILELQQRGQQQQQQQTSSRHELLLKLLSEQRNRDLLALATGNHSSAENSRRASLSMNTARTSPIAFAAPAPSSCSDNTAATLHRIMQQQQQQRQEERQKLLIQELLAKQAQQQQQQAQQQQQQQHQDVRMALLALQQQQGQR